MCRVAVSRKADDFTVNGRAARFGVLQFFKNQRTCAFTNHGEISQSATAEAVVWF